MTDGLSTESPNGGMDKISKRVEILSKERRAAIAESLSARGISFGIYPDPGEGGRDTKLLEPYKDLIESVGLTAIAEVAQEMPIQNVSIGIFDKTEWIIREFGIGAYTHGYANDSETSLIEINLDSHSSDIPTAVRKYLRKILRHELHHDRRFDSLGQYNIKTLLDAIIFEGLATHYEIEGSVDDPPLYAAALSTEQILTLLKRAREHFSSEDTTIIDEWYSGSDEMGIRRSEEEKIPKWALITLGHHLVGEYLKAHPGQKASTLHAVQAEEFLKSYDVQASPRE